MDERFHSTGVDFALAPRSPETCLEVSLSFDCIFPTPPFFEVNQILRRVLTRPIRTTAFTMALPPVMKIGSMPHIVRAAFAFNDVDEPIIVSGFWNGL
jgi:hypothetical protein